MQERLKEMRMRAGGISFLVGHTCVFRQRAIGHVVSMCRWARCAGTRGGRWEIEVGEMRLKEMRVQAALRLWVFDFCVLPMCNLARCAGIGATL